VKAIWKAVVVDNGKQWLTAILAVLGLAAAIILYSQADDLGVKNELALVAAVVLGATGHLALAHAQGRVAPIHGAMVFSMAVVGVVAGVVGVLAAAVTNEDATTLGLAVAGLGGAVAGAETLTRLAARSLGTPAVSSIERSGRKLTLIGQGLSGVKHVTIDGRQVDATVQGNTLTCDIPDPAPAAGSVVRVGSDDQSARLALPS
jgi:hypothetical protein